jgi:hypothetical protein
MKVQKFTKSPAMGISFRPLVALTVAGLAAAWPFW